MRIVNDYEGWINGSIALEILKLLALGPL
jgi:hypothetical protein